ncbi:lunapark [Schizosaccharomyces cryophilus OY26]|uniref:Endoplasmic reticulum junction formation protein lunapark n=1 Tax=Schizosaccharomyces cryophilus (strain OY26 / ATCC MYA-4695 / CBS 11777 / NBRC 106824 / NRRL Y48691) TaxID=653667 RepID=S9VTT5_SCHCR|nr:lunapark [Schizosaccharomyces cryophilus OY26]EPY51283.1 lunapark [Schizosaccharomyces cryophilus OY26]
MSWLFKKKKQVDFGGELDRLEERLDEVQYKIETLKEKKKNIQFRYSILSFLIYTVAASLRAYRSSLLVDHRVLSTSLWIVLYLLGVGLLYLLRHGIAWIYERRLRRANSRRRKFQEEKRQLLDALKSRKEYFETQALLEKYGEQSPRSRKQVVDFGKRKGKGGSGEPGELPVGILPNSSVNDAQSQHWYDKVLEGLVGADEREEQNREALICQHCFRHNGLASVGERAKFVRYVCLYCKAWNGPSLDSDRSSLSSLTPRRSKSTSSSSRLSESLPVETTPVPETKQHPGDLPLLTSDVSPTPIPFSAFSYRKSLVPATPPTSAAAMGAADTDYPDVSVDSIYDSFHTVANDAPDVLSPIQEQNR